MVGIVAIVAIVIIAIVARGGGKRTAVVDARSIDAAAPAVVPEIDAGMSCTEACKQIVGCDLYDDRFCLDACAKDPATQKCLDTLHDGCQAFALCVDGFNCKGVVPSGHQSCKQVATCQSKCKNDYQCGCDCAAKLDPSPARVTALFHLDACANWCKLDLDCITKNCVQQGLSCVKQ